MDFSSTFLTHKTVIILHDVLCECMNVGKCIILWLYKNNNQTSTSLSKIISYNISSQNKDVLFTTVK